MATNVILRNILMPTVLPVHLQTSCKHYLLGKYTCVLCLSDAASSWSSWFWSWLLAWLVTCWSLFRRPRLMPTRQQRYIEVYRCRRQYLRSFEEKKHVYLQVVNTPRNIAHNNCKRKVANLAGLHHMKACCEIVIYYYIRFSTTQV